MNIETYEAKDDEGAVALVNDPESLKLIEELGLTGQQSLQQERQIEGESVSTRMPYRYMTMEEQRIYAVLCPSKTPLAKYDAEPIPLRVLQVAAHAKAFLPCLGVWHPADAAMEDPILIGYDQPDPDRFQYPHGKPFLLARWGRVLLPLEELRVLAAERLTAQWKAGAAKARAALLMKEQALEDLVQGHLQGGEQLTVPHGYSF